MVPEAVDLGPAVEACLASARSIILLSESLFSLQIGVEVGYSQILSTTPPAFLSFPTSSCTLETSHHRHDNVLSHWLLISRKQGFYNHAFFLESACFVLVLAAVYDNDIDDRDACTRHVEHVKTGLTLLRRLGCHREPIRSIVAALEQMLARVNALRSNPRRSDATAEAADDDARQQGEGHQRPDAMGATDAQREGVSLTAPAFGQSGAAAAGTAAPLVSGESSGVLDELWSMTDWDMSFPFLDIQSYVPR